MPFPERAGCCSPCTACSGREAILLSSAIPVLFRELQLPCRKVVAINVIFTELPGGLLFQHLGLCGAPATAGLFVNF